MTSNIPLKNTAANLYNCLTKTTENYPDNIAYVGDGGNGASYSYKKVLNLTEKLAAGLLVEQFASIEEIGIISENRPEYAIAYLSIVSAGKVVVPIDANLKENEIEYLINHASLKIVFASEKFATMLSEMFPNLQIYCFDEGSSNHWLTLCHKDVPDLNNKAESNSVAVLIYTSGTTGSPKAVELTHGNLISNLYNIREVYQVRPDDIFISLLPLHHTFEATAGFLTPLVAGSKVVYARSLKSKEILEDIKNNRITFMLGVPLLYEKTYQSFQRGIVKAPLFRKIIFKIFFFVSSIAWRINWKIGKILFKGMRKRVGMNSIRLMISGGAALPQNIAAFFNYIGFDFCQGYGMTECSPVITVNVPENMKFDSVGPPLPGVEIAIAKADITGVGEIIVKGENVTSGYRNNPEATSELIKDGWLYTGDLGKILKGHLYITGRKKNLIVSAAGKNIYPEQIEEQLIQSSFILEAVVFGRVYDGKQGEEVRAVIVPDLEQFKQEFKIDQDKPDNKKIETVLKTEILKINNIMADYKRVKNYEIQLDELEKTSTKKIKRFIYK